MDTFLQLDIYPTPPIANPLSPGLVLLVLTLPGILALGMALARWAAADAELTRALAPGVALCAWLLSIHVLARATASFGLGLLLASLALGLAGGWLALARRRAAPEPPGPEPPPSARWAAATAIATTALLVPIAWRWAFHDELNLNGHMGLVATIQNGGYPPRNSAFPDLEQAYHYGVDLFAAVLTALFRLPVDHAIDATLLLGWAYGWYLSFILGERLVGRGRGWLLSVLLLLSAGYPFFCWTNFVQSLPLGGHLLGACFVDGQLPSAPTISNFFQHPWSLGIPVGLCAIAVSAQRGSARETHRLALLALLMAFLSLCQVVLFVTLLPALVVAEAFAAGAFAPRRALHGTAAMLLAAAVATQLGGFFANGGGVATALELQLGAGPYLGPRPLWFWTSFGLCLPLGLIGLFGLQRERLLFALLALGSLLTMILFRYRLTWDIVKFAQVAQIGLALPAACLLARLLGSHRLALRVGGGALLVLTLPTALAFIGILGLRVPGPPVMYLQVPPPMTAHEAEAASWLRRALRPGEIVYRRRDGYLYGFWSWAGLPGVHVDPGFVLPAERLARRTALMTARPPAIEPYRSEGVRYLVLDALDTDLMHAAQSWIAQGSARRVRSFGPLQVIELLDRPS